MLKDTEHDARVSEIQKGPRLALTLQLQPPVDDPLAEADVVAGDQRKGQVLWQQVFFLLTPRGVEIGMSKSAHILPEPIHHRPDVAPNLRVLLLAQDGDFATRHG